MSRRQCEPVSFQCSVFFVKASADNALVPNDHETGRIFRRAVDPAISRVVEAFERAVVESVVADVKRDVHIMTHDVGQ